jgi:excisionase family DNA binding protein
MLEGLLTATEVADLLDISPRTVRRWAEKGYLPRHRLVGRWVFRRAEIEAFVARARGQETWPEVEGVSAAAG